MPANKALVNFIKEARKRGFDDWSIKKPLLEKGWPAKEIDIAFIEANKNYAKNKTKASFEDSKVKNRITIQLEDSIVKIVEKRAKKNMLSVQEQIEDIVRRSCVMSKSSKSLEQEKLDDLLIGVFSRKNSGRKKR